MESPEYEVRTYETIDGKVPFNEWLKSLGDRKGRAVIRTRISRLQLGLFGDAKSVGEGVNELRISFGPGYRVYYALEGKSVILLLCGGDKSTQDKDIKLAKGYWDDYGRRDDDDESKLPR
jgi:putative addiction module killer protein